MEDIRGHLEAGGYLIPSVEFYRVVVQAVILFGAEMLVLLAAIEKWIVGFHMGFYGR